MPDGFYVEFVFDSREERRELGRFLKGLYGKLNCGRDNETLEETRYRRAGDD